MGGAAAAALLRRGEFAVAAQVELARGDRLIDVAADAVDFARAEIRFRRERDVRELGVVCLCISGAGIIHLFGAEQDDTSRAAGSLRQSGDQPGGADSLARRPFPHRGALYLPVPTGSVAKW